jgi:hypothetical protein
VVPAESAPKSPVDCMPIAPSSSWLTSTRRRSMSYGSVLAVDPETFKRVIDVNVVRVEEALVAGLAVNGEQA